MTADLYRPDPPDGGGDPTARRTDPERFAARGEATAFRDWLAAWLDAPAPLPPEETP